MTYCSASDVRNNIHLENTEPSDTIVNSFISKADKEIDEWCEGSPGRYSEIVEYSYNKSVYKLKHDFKEIVEVTSSEKTLDEYNESNIIENAYVEESATGTVVDDWTDTAGTGDTLTWSSTYAFTLNRSLKITKAAAVNSYWESDGQTVDETSEYRATARIKVDSNTSGYAYLKLTFEDSDGTVIQTFTSNAVSQEITQPSSASVLECKSDSASDTEEIVTIEGTVDGLTVAETVALNGTTGVSTTNSFTYINGVRKSDDTAGSVTVTSNSAGVTNATLTAKESEKSDWIKAEVIGASSPEGATAKVQFYVSSSATSGDAYADSFTLNKRNYKPLYASMEIKLFQTMDEHKIIEVEYIRSRMSKLVKEISKDLASFYVIANFFGIETSCKSYDDMRFRFYGGKLASPKLQVLAQQIESNRAQLLNYDNTNADFGVGEIP